MNETVHIVRWVLRSIKSHHHRHRLRLIQTITFQTSLPFTISIYNYRYLPVSVTPSSRSSSCTFCFFPPAQEAGFNSFMMIMTTFEASERRKSFAGRKSSGKWFPYERKKLFNERIKAVKLKPRSHSKVHFSQPTLVTRSSQQR